MTEILINQLNAKIDYHLLDSLYDVFEIKYDGKFIRNVSTILDANSFDNSILGVFYESGNKMYFLMHSNTGNQKNINEVINKSDMADRLTFRRVYSKELKTGNLLQLLFNGIPGLLIRNYRYSNISGHTYIVVSKSKTGLKTLEIKVDSNCYITLPVRSFTNKKYDYLLEYKKGKSWKSYPQFCLDEYHVLHRNDGTFPIGEAYIMRQLPNRKNEIPFIDFGSQKKSVFKDERFQKSKTGILVSAINDFNYVYKNAVEIIGFEEIELDKRIVADSSKKALISALKIIEGKKLTIIDKVNSSMSKCLIDQLTNIVKGYNINVTIGDEEKDAEFVINLIHDAEWYEKNEKNDEHVPSLKNAVQHITVEEFTDDKQKLTISPAAVRACLFDLQVKRDLVFGRLDSISNEMIELILDWKFFIPLYYDEESKTCTSVLSMQIFKDKSFVVKEYHYDLMNEDNKLLNKIITFVNYIGFQKAQYLMADPFDNVSAIIDTRMYGVPDIFEIWNRLKQGDTSIRNKEARSKLLASITDINYFENENHQYYFVGLAGSGMQSKVVHAVHIHEIVSYPGDKTDVSPILELLQVVIVRNGLMSAMPFPIKYLKEYIKMSMN